MRILYLNHYAGSPCHGMEFRPYYLAREWVRAGHEVHIVAADFSHLRQVNPSLDTPCRDEVIDGVTYTWCRTPEYSGNGAKRVVNIFAFLRRLVGLTGRIQREKPDLIIASSTYPLDTVPAAWLAKKTGARLVYEVHDLWPLTPVEVGGMSKKHPFVRLLQWAEDFGYKKADTVISMLPCAKDYMVEHGMEPAKYAVIPNGVDVEEWQDDPAPLPAVHAARLAELKAAGRFLVGYAGGHGLANALDYLLDAAAQLNDVPVTFVLVGDGPDKAALAEKARGSANVVFLDAIEKRAVPAFLEQMDALFIGWRRLPIYRFGINPNKLFDYLMAGKPVIHSVEAGNDLVAESGAGLSVAAEDPAAIADAVRRMVALPATERARMGEAGRQAVLEKHDYRVLARRFLDACRLRG
ncbi:glycosyltransferase family 4 protein [Crenobacter cavernae]|uniref:Glycosyltransferase WbuB n=1 Tax=Crenobacter cavernae TaxID=2290923 RepID=A0A345Y3H5_9NEIS|nr:glycosyltransferase family 4 protein [Crenobacter cavernae]AXK38477.1 glycosyltransferase WbuB [Crenobacter cavernae]